MLANESLAAFVKRSRNRTFMLYITKSLKMPQQCINLAHQFCI